MIRLDRLGIFMVSRSDFCQKNHLKKLTATSANGSRAQVSHPEASKPGEGPLRRIGLLTVSAKYEPPHNLSAHAYNPRCRKDEPDASRPDDRIIAPGFVKRIFFENGMVNQANLFSANTGSILQIALYSEKIAINFETFRQRLSYRRIVDCARTLIWPATQDSLSTRVRSIAKTTERPVSP